MSNESSVYYMISTSRGRGLIVSAPLQAAQLVNMLYLVVLPFYTFCIVSAMLGNEPQSCAKPEHSPHLVLCV